MSSKSSAVAVYDFTISFEKVPTKQAVIDGFKGWCKKWCFQKEKSDTGYVHWQGRMSLMKRRRLPELLKMLPDDHPFKQGRISVTSNGGMGDTFYVIKNDTRVEGPWADTDEKIYIPRQIREVKELRPFQQTIVDSANVWDNRTINVVYCPHGNNGKTILVGYIRAHRIGRVLPPCNDHLSLMRACYCLPESKMYLVDMPRSFNQEKLASFYHGIECIKDGYCYDDRYKFQERSFDCPQIWIFCNVMPKSTYLSNDRWKIWTINASYELVPYVE